MKKISYLLISVMILSLFSVGSLLASEEDNVDDEVVIDERYGKPKLVLGEALTEDQKNEVRGLLDAENSDLVDEFIITAEDLVEFIGGDPSSNMYSSAKITRRGEGTGIVVNIVNPDNITEVTNEMYANAILTAGIENAEIDVASPVRVSGHSALTGVYKAFNVEGEELDKERMEVATEELDLATDLAENVDLGQDKVSELLSRIKSEISENNPKTREDIENIINKQLEELGIELGEEDYTRLVDLFEKMKDININFSNVKEQLDGVMDDIKERISEVDGEKIEGFWNKVKDFFSNLFDGIKSAFE